MNRLYGVLKQKSRGCRDRDLRIKIELFLLALKLGSVSEACARRGFSRKFYYKWWNRFKRSGYELRALEEYSRRPRHSPGKIESSIEFRIQYFKRKHYGSRMIEAYLKRDGKSVSRSTICHILRKRQKAAPLSQKARLKLHRKRYELLIPGQRMQLDVKYVPERVDGKKLYAYVIVDECTRWRFAQAYDQLCEGSTVAFLEALKLACPFPIHTIQTDNGQEFTYSLIPSASHIKHGMDEWCEKNKIRHRLIPPGVKELNGKVERSHRIDEQYFYWRAATRRIDHFQMQLARWIGYYNTQRPHGGINYLTPMEKLKERLEALKKPLAEVLPEDLENHRLKFIGQAPNSRIVDDYLDDLLALEKDLQALLKAA